MKRLTARDIMTTDILTADPDWTVKKLSHFLDEHSITGAPVVDSLGKPIGVVSVTDIARDHSVKNPASHGDIPHDFYSSSQNLPQWQEVINTLNIEPKLKIKVKDIMTPMIFDVQEDTPIHLIADTMIRGRIHRVFVTKAQKLTGIITALDMLQVIRNYTGEE